jgi:hypothetical protein
MHLAQKCTQEFLLSEDFPVCCYELMQEQIGDGSIMWTSLITESGKALSSPLPCWRKIFGTSDVARQTTREVHVDLPPAISTGNAHAPVRKQEADSVRDYKMQAEEQQQKDEAAKPAVNALTASGPLSSSSTSNASATPLQGDNYKRKCRSSLR